MHKAGENLYIWPTNDEISREYLTESIVCKLSEPELINTREHYKFKNITHTINVFTLMYKHVNYI